MSDHHEVEPSPYEICRVCGELAFEPARCETCGSKGCSDHMTDCEPCGLSYCDEHLEQHGCKRKADPADVLMLEAFYADNWLEKLDEAYRINGRTYFAVGQRRTGFEPLNVTLYRFDGVKEKDVWTTGNNASGYVAEPQLQMDEVGHFDGVLGRTVWTDDEAEADHRAAGDER